MCLVGILTSLDAVRNADRVIDALRLADDLAFDANRDGGARTIRVLSSALHGDDQIAAIASVHALAQVFDGEADVVLSGLLSDTRGFIREHAAWALSSRLPRFDTIGRLVAFVSAGGFAGMLAQRTLEQWSSPSPEHVALALEGALLGVRDPESRYRLVETLGLVRSRIATGPMLRIASDITEPHNVRVAAISALGQRRGEHEVATLLASLAVETGLLADVANLALVDLAAPALPPKSSERLSVAQLFLHADIDAGLEHSGRGDNGGIATLLVRLGDALIAGRETETRVLTMSRGSVEDALESVTSISNAGSGHIYGRIPLLSEPVQSANAWPMRVAARRGIRRLLRAAGGVDVVHLRMADVGSLAAADVARELDIPVVFTVAPDPHAVINTLDLSGRLTRHNFGDIDETEHFWYRARLVQQLAANSAHTVLFPRPELAADMKKLVGIDITDHPERHTIVPEGIDLDVVDRGVEEAADFAAGRPATPALEQLRELLEQLPPERRGLPFIVSVGRFHRVKGMATIVDAWANGLRDRANLLLIGGDLVTPSADEREQLALIDAVVAPTERRENGLILAGHRPNDIVARWVAAARFGVPELAAPRGIYVCGSLKEEFGIALLEAMGAGLLVVGPDGGGPATYVEQGVTGFLAPTWDPVLLREAMGTALTASADESGDARALRSRETVEKSFTIQAMARALSVVYEQVDADEIEMREAMAPLKPVTV